jgi:hypothetical protein
MTADSIRGSRDAWRELAAGLSGGSTSATPTPPCRPRSPHFIAAIGDTTDERFGRLAGSFDRLLTGVRRRAPRATVVLVDYLTLLPPDEDTEADPLPAAVTSWGRADRCAADHRDREGRGPIRMPLPPPRWAARRHAG